MENLKGKLLIFVTMMIFIVGSCKKDNDLPAPGPMGLTFEEVINAGGMIDPPTVNEAIDTTNIETNVNIGHETYNCTTITYDVNAASGGTGGFPLFNPTADVIYPGSMLQGNSLNQATPNPIVVNRAGGDLSIDILDGNLVSSFEVDEVKKSTITNGINNIIANATGTLPANFNLKVESIQSREEFALALGVDVDGAFLDLESRLDYAYNSDKSAFMVTLNQSYYTISFDLPTSLDELFAPSVTPQQLANYVGVNNPATYISSVNYGRIFYLLIESSSTQHALDVAVRSAFNGVTTDVEATLDINYFNDLEEVTYSVFAYGGDAAPTFDATGVADINSLIDVLKQSTSLGAAKPLSYVVRNVSNNQIVATQLATTYDVVECEPVGAQGTHPALAHWTNHPLLEDFGPITAAYSDGPEKQILVNAQGQWLRSTIDSSGEGQLEGPYEMNGLPFASVGATCRIRGPLTSLYVFNGLGNQYAVLDINGNWSQIYQHSSYFSGQSPFLSVGVGAIAYFEEFPNLPANAFPWGHTHYMFNKPGNGYAIVGWEPNSNDQHFYDVADVNTDLEVQGKIDGVGAALGFQYDTGSNFDLGVLVMFNLAGTAYVVRADFGNGVEVIGPFEL
jgi:thiol-activated cytolysin